MLVSWEHADAQDDANASITNDDVQILVGDEGSGIGYTVDVTAGTTDTGFGTVGKGFVADVQVQGDSVTATAAELRAQVTAGSGTPYALLCTAGFVDLGLPNADPGIPGALYYDSITNIVKRSP